MVDIQTVSITIASAGVFVAAIYYVLQLRNQTKMRQTDMLWRIQSSFSSKEFLEAVMKIEVLEYRNYSDFEEKYGQFFSETQSP